MQASLLNMKKLLFGFLSGFLLFCAVSVVASTPFTLWPDGVMSSGVSFSNSGSYSLPDATWTVGSFYSFGGDDGLYSFVGGGGIHTLGCFVYQGQWTWGVSIGSDWVTGSIGFGAYGPALDPSGLQTGLTPVNSQNSPVTTNSTNFVVSANTNDHTWATVIRQGVDGSTNVLKISLSVDGIQKLLSDSSYPENSLFKVCGTGRSVFQNEYGGSFFEDWNSQFFSHVQFVAPWERSALSVADTRMTFDGDALKVTGIGSGLDTSQMAGDISVIRQTIESDSTFWRGEWTGAWGQIQDFFTDIKNAIQNIFVDSHGTVFKTADGDSVFRNPDGGESWLSYLKPNTTNFNITTNEPSSNEVIDAIGEQVEHQTEDSSNTVAGATAVDEASINDESYLQGLLKLFTLSGLFPSMSTYPSIHLFTWNEQSYDLIFDDESYVPLFRSVCDILLFIAFSYLIGRSLAAGLGGGSIS